MVSVDVKSRLRVIRDKVEHGGRLDMEDGIFLYSPDVPLQEVGLLANEVRERINGNVGYYNINTHLNPTNVCVYRCRFCAFRSDLRDPKGYAMSDQQILERGREAMRMAAPKCTSSVACITNVDTIGIEVCFNCFTMPTKIHLKAWTAVEISWFEFLQKWTQSKY